MASHSKISLSIPLDLLIKVDIERGKNNLSRSRWIKEAIEAKMAIDEEKGEEASSSRNLSLDI